MQLTEQQERVAAQTAGRHLVSACPGSGKTHTVVTRSDRLFGHGKRLLLAFNKMAQQEMEKRAQQKMGAEFKTFHAFCLREVLGNWRDYGFKSKPDIDRFGLNLGRLAESNGKHWFKWGPETGLDRDITNLLSRFYFDDELEKIRDKAEAFLNTEKHKIQTDDDLPDETKSALLIDLAVSDAAYRFNACKAILNYRAWLRKNNSVTFDTMIMLVAQNPEKITATTDHFIIDEYQDVDRFQYRIAKHFAANSKSWMAVGDPNQRIYEWRGALQNAFTKFREEYPDTQVLPLTTNFRSYDEIIRLAEKICPVGMTGVRGKSELSLSRASHPLAYIIDRLEKPYSNNAVLCKRNRDTAKSFLTLVKEGIPAHINADKSKGDFFSQPHMTVALKANAKGYNIHDLRKWDEWKDCMKAHRYKDPDGLKEAEDDASWILELTAQDIHMIRTMDDPKGVFISTVHKTKGLEFSTVFYRDPGGWGEDQERLLNYVACTRAKNRLILYP